MPVTERRRTSARRESLLGDQPGAYASARFVRITPMKARRVTQMIHGLPVDDALSLLQFAPQAAAETVYKVLESAVANAETTEDLDRADLVVSNCQVDEGPTMKRWRPRALDLDLGDAGPLHALGEQLADGDVLADVRLVELVGVPPRLVVGGDAEAEAVRVDLLAHQAFPFFRFFVGACVAAGVTTRVMWLVRLRIRVARPWARGRQRFIVGPSSTWQLLTTRSARSRSSVVSALATALSSTL